MTIDGKITTGFQIGLNISSLSLFQVKTLRILSLVFKTEYKVNQLVFSWGNVNNRKIEELYWKRYYFWIRVSSGIKPEEEGLRFLRPQTSVSWETLEKVENCASECHLLCDSRKN